MHTYSPSHGFKRSRHSCPRRVNAGNKNTPSIHHPPRRNVTPSMVGLKMVTYEKVSPKMAIPRNIAGDVEKEAIQIFSSADALSHRYLNSSVGGYHEDDYQLNTGGRLLHFDVQVCSRWPDLTSVSRRQSCTVYADGSGRTACRHTVQIQSGAVFSAGLWNHCSQYAR